MRPSSVTEETGWHWEETAWTGWTLPPAISGCCAQRCHRRPPVSSCPRWASQNA